MFGATVKAHPKHEKKIRGAILVVEDEVLVRMMIAGDLRNAGYTVIEASTAREALELLRQMGKDVRLIFSDVRMPGTMDGTAMARSVRSEFPAIKIMLTSGNLTGLEGAKHDGFFLKPYDSAKIIKHITALLN
jgi:CheY-like chemotaxis protein